MLRRLIAPLALVSLAATFAAGAAEPDQVGSLGRVAREGIAAELSVRRLAGEAGAPLAEGDDVEVVLRLTYEESGEPVPGAFPAVWMARRAGAEPSTADACREQVEVLAGGSLFSQAELDLNVFYVVTLNHDATLSVVDPLFGFGGTRLLALVELPGPGVDWVLAGDELYVSIPSKRRLAVVDTRSWTVAREIELPGEPRRIAAQPDGHYLWVALEGETPGVAVVERGAAEPAKVLPLPPGPHELAFDGDGGRLYVASRQAGMVTVLDISSLTPLARVATGEEPVSLAWSELAGRIFVSHGKDGRIVALDGGRVIGAIATEPGLGQIRFSPDGRWGFALNPEKDLVHVLDAASGRIVQTGDFPGAPDQVIFTDELAYVRHLEHETILMVPLRALGDPGAPIQVVDFPGGQRPFGEKSGPALAAGIVRSPEATAVLVAHPADETVYYYREGMAAPMGSFKNYGRQPRAVLVVDRSLTETAPGEYRTVVRLRRPGPYDAALLVQAPLVVHCFPFEVAAAPGTAEERVARLEVLAAPEGAVAGREVRLAFRLVDAATGEPLPAVSDVTAMAVKPPGAWHRRPVVRATGEGSYEITLTPPSPGRYVVHVGSASAGLDLARGATSFEVGE